MPLSFKAPPRISREQFAAVLQKGTADFGASPAAPFAGEMYDIFVSYGIDPAVPLAFFAHESQYGNDGICKKYDTKSLGNVRTAYDASRALGQVQTHNGLFAQFKTWPDGTRDWCDRIIHNYIEKRGLETVEAAIPVYAPSSDGNNVQRYIDHVNELVVRWQKADPNPPQAGQTSTTPAASAPATTGGPSLAELQLGLFEQSFIAVGAQFRPDWSFHQYALTQARAGRFLGSPLGESRRISVGGSHYSVQVFALDTLYTPIANPESATNWNDVRRLSDLLKQG